MEKYYTQRDVCTELNLSKAWIDKIEKMFKIESWASGTPGKKSSYTYENYEFFRKIAVLRSLNFSLEYIKALFDLEEKLNDLLRSNYGA